MTSSNTDTAAVSQLLAIGELAKKTGLSPERLRSWEQRYGVPQPVRLDSGHRRYPESQVEFLMDVGRLLAFGFKASELLRQLPGDLRASVKSVGTDSFDALESWFSLVQDFDAKGFGDALELASEEMGLVKLMDTRLSPFLWEIGERWARGEIRVAHEHFATNRISQLLGDLAGRKIVEKKAGVKILLTTLPGDLHGVGVSMVDAVLGEEGIETVVLGADSPVKEIAAAAKSASVSHIAISISRGAAQKGVGKVLDELIEMAPDCELLLGGGGVSLGIRLPRGVRQFRSMAEFQRWLGDLK